MPPPPRPSGGGARGPEAPPYSPPPSHSGPRAEGGRPKKRRPRTPPEEAAAPGVRGHHGRGRRPHALPAAGRRRTGGAQDGANRAALSEAGPGKTGARTRAGGSPPPPPPPPPTLSAQISATTKRGCRPWAGSSWGPGNRGADLLLPPPPPTEMGPDRKQAQHPPPPRMPSHPHCRPSHGDPGPSGSGRRATSMLGSATRMVTQQVVLLSHASEQVDPSTTLTPPPPSLRPRREGCTESAPSGPKKWRL